MRLAAFLLLLPLAARAAGDQEFLVDMFSAGVRPGARASVETRQYADVKAAGRDFSLRKAKASVSAPVGSALGGNWRVTAYGEHDAIGSGATFPNGRGMPVQLWDPGLGTSYSRNLENGQSVGTTFGVSSPADHPFTAGRDLGFNLNFSWRFPQPDGNAWMVFLGASNTRGFLPWVPLPGAAYFFKAGTLRGLVGVPFGVLYWVPLEKLAFTAFYFPIRTFELRVAYGDPRGLQVYSLAGHRTRNFRLTDRTEDKERLFVEEGVLEAGVALPLAPGVVLDVGGGSAFSRRFYLAEKLTQRTDAPRVSPDNGAYGLLKVNASL